MKTTKVTKPRPARATEPIATAIAAGAPIPVVLDAGMPGPGGGASARPDDEMVTFTMRIPRELRTRWQTTANVLHDGNVSDAVRAAMVIWADHAKATAAKAAAA